MLAGVVKGETDDTERIFCTPFLIGGLALFMTFTGSL